MHVLAIVKDITPLNYLLLLKNVLEAKGHTLTLLCEEGAALKKVRQSGIQHETTLPQTNAMYSVVIVGCSVGSSFEKGALELFGGRVPTIGICDIQGAHERHDGVYADHYVIPNAAAAALLPSRRMTRIGDVNVRPLDVPAPSIKQEVRGWLNGSRAVVVIAQRNFQTLKVVERCVSGHTDQKLILGLHPDPKKWPERNRVEALLKRLEGRAIITSDLSHGLDTLGAIACLNPQSTIVVTSYSGGGTTAAAAGYNVALVDGKQVREEFRMSCPPGTGPLPLNRLISAPVVTMEQAPINLFELEYPSLEQRSALQPYDPSLFFAVIKAMLQ